MNTSAIVLQVIKANINDEIRRDKYILTLLAIVFLIVAAVPPPAANHTFIMMEGYRPLYNSAWIGTLVALLISIILALPGFFLLRGQIDKDRHLGVSQLYATTRVSRMTYVLGKYVSNIAALSLIVLVTIISAMLLQLNFGEEPYIHLWDILSPFLLISLPVVLMVSALSIVFETVKGLRGNVGNFLYLLIWLAMLLYALQPGIHPELFFINPANDPLGISNALTSISAAVKEQHNDFNGVINLGISVNDFNKVVTPVTWEGLQWNAVTLAGRLFWVGVSILCMVLSALAFFRFDPAVERKRKNAGIIHPHGYVGEINLIFPALQKFVMPILCVSRWHRFWILFQAELKKLIKETAWWWFVVSAVLIVVCAVAPFEIMRAWLLPLVWIWPIFIWSRLGMRLSAHYRAVQGNRDPQQDALFMQVVWAIGFLVAATLASGAAVRFILDGNWATLCVLTISAAFIPSLAFVLSIWTNSSYAFEGAYVLLWLVGCVSKHPFADFMGTLQDSIAVQNPFVYLVWTIALLTFAAVGKQRLIDR